MLFALRLRLSIIACVCCFFVVKADAQLPWQQVGGEEFSVAFSGSTAFAISYYGRILRYDDGLWKLAANCPSVTLGIAFRGNRGIVTGKQFIMSTVDGGRTWMTRTDTNLHSDVLSLASDDTVYSLTFRSILLRSVDLGATWDSVCSVRSLQFTAADFSTPQIGYVYADTNTIQRTTDAGHTWDKLNFEGRITNIRCFGDTIIVASHPKGISVSVDRGESWVHSSLDTSVIGYVHDITRNAAGDWVAVGYHSNKRNVRVMLSTDRGKTWAPSVSEKSATYYHLRNIGFCNDLGIAAGSGGAIFRTDDDGESWSRTAGSELMSFELYNPVLGVSVGKSGKIFTSGIAGSLSQSTDEGLTWLEQAGEFDARHYRYTHEYSDKVLLTCGLDYAFERSTDGGRTWVGNVTMPKLGYSRIRQKGKTLWMAASKYLMQSLDSGVSWTIIDSIPLTINELIILPDGRFAAVGGTSGEAAKACFSISDQDGRNWQSTVFDTVKGLFGLAYLSTDTLIACGRDGLLLVSSDLGESWTSHRTGFGGLTQKLANLNDTLLIGAASVGIIESRDRGVTWSRIDFPELRRVQGAPPSVAMTDVAVTENGKVVVAGSEMVFIRNLEVDSSFTATVETRRPKNIYLRLKPYPNPSIDGKAKVSVWGLAPLRGVKRQLGLYDLLGHKVLDLSHEINRDLDALTLDVEFDTRDLAKGAYMLVLDAGGDRLSEQIVIY